MKNLIILAIIIVIALIGYSYFANGKIPFIPSFAQSGEEQELAQLADEFRDARTQYMQAGRTAGLTGLDSTSEADSALGEINRIERDLADLKAGLTSDDARKKAARLETEIKAFKRGLR